MAQTYPSISVFTAGQTLTAAQMNDLRTWLANQRVPPAAIVRRTTDFSSYTSYADITWESAATDTDGMWVSGTPTRLTVGTSGLYSVHLHIYLTGSATITAGEARINVSGNTVLDSQVPSYGTTGLMVDLSGIVSVTAGDYITAGVGVSGGSAYVIKGNASTTFLQTRLTVAWIGQTA